MKKFMKFISIGTVSAVSLLGAGVASATTHSGSTLTPRVTAAHLVKVTRVAFKGSYRGTIGLLFNANAVSATSVKGRGSGTLLGASTMTGAGTGASSAYCDPSSKSQACVPSGTQSAPASVTVSGIAKVTSGTGKFKGVSGTLSFKGSFAVRDSTTGTSESDAYSATLTGTLTIKH